MRDVKYLAIARYVTERPLTPDGFLNGVILCILYKSMNKKENETILFVSFELAFLRSYIFHTHTYMKRSIVFLVIAALVCGALAGATRVVAAGTSYKADLVAGQGYNNTPVFTTGGINNTPNAEGVDTPWHLAVDDVHHRLFVADSHNNRVLVFELTSAGQLSGYDAAYVLGQPGLNSNSATTTQGGMSNPTGLAYDAANDRLFVTDQGNNRVLVFNTATIADGQNAVYVFGQANFAGSTSGTSPTTLYAPDAVAYDAATGRLFVGDQLNNRVLVFDADPAVIADGEAATTVLGATDVSTIGSGIMSTSTFSSPDGLAYDTTDNWLFVSDFSNNRVLVFDGATSTMATNEDASYVLGSTSFTTATSSGLAAQLYEPAQLAYDAAGQRLFVADNQYGRTLAFDVASSTIVNGESATHVLGRATLTSSGSASPAQNVTNYPQGVAYDAVNKILFVSDTGYNRIMVFPASNITDGENATDVLGQVDKGIVSWTTIGANDAPNAKGVYNPRDVAVDTVHHRLFVADSENNRVLVFNLSSSNQLVDYSADYVLGQPNFKSSSSPLSQSSLFDPVALAYDVANDRLFVADQLSHRVVVFDVGAITNGMNASYVLGEPDFTTKNIGSPETTSTMDYPTGLAYDDADGLLFVSDGYSQNIGFNRVLVYKVAPAVIANGENAWGVLGQTDFVSNTSGTSQNQFAGPTGLAYDSAHHYLYVADSKNNRVLVFDVSGFGGGALLAGTDGENALYVLGQPDFTSNAKGTSSTALSLYLAVSNGCRPLCVTTYSYGGGLSYDGANQLLYVGDAINNRVLAFDVSSITNGQAAIGVLGQPDFTSNGSGTSQTSFNTPMGIAYNPSTHNLFVADDGNNRVLDYAFVQITTASLPSATLGAAYSQPIAVSNNQGTVSFSLASGSLPPGMHVGSVDGTPTAAGTYNFTILAADTLGGAGYFLDTKNYTLAVASPAPAVVSGGGGLPPIAYAPPSAPAIGSLEMTINNDAATTDDQRVSLALFAGSNVTSMALSNVPDFIGISQQPYTSSTPWDLCSGLTSCDQGSHTVYAKFYTSWGQVSDPIQATIALTASGTPALSLQPVIASSSASTTPTAPILAGQQLLTHLRLQLLTLLQQLVTLLTQQLQGIR